MVESGLSENVKLLDSSGTDRTDELGFVESATFRFDEAEEAERSVGSGGKPIDIRDSTVEFTGSLTFKPTTLKGLRVFGDFTDDGDGTYTITFPGDQQLEQHNELKGQFDGNNVFSLRDVKLDDLTVEAGLDDAVTVEFGNVLALDGDVQDGSVSLSQPSDSVLQWTDAEVLINGTIVGTVESASLSINRNVSSEYGITGSTGGDARKPIALVEGNYEFEPSIVIKVQDERAYEEALDDSGTTISIQGDKSKQSLSLDFGGDGKFKFTDAKFTAEDFEMQSEKDARTVELSGTAEDAEVTGEI
jgi:hypothetical protein